MNNNEFINYEQFEGVAEEIRKLVEAERDTMDKLPADEESSLFHLITKHITPDIGVIPKNLQNFDKNQSYKLHIAYNS